MSENVRGINIFLRMSVSAAVHLKQREYCLVGRATQRLEFDDDGMIDAECVPRQVEIDESRHARGGHDSIGLV